MAADRRIPRAEKLRDRQILHDHRVDARRGDRVDFAAKRVVLVVKDQRVDRDVHLHAARMAVGDDRGKIRGAEIFRVSSCVEAGRAEINGVRACTDRGDELLGTADRRKNFQFLFHVHMPMFTPGVRGSPYIRVGLQGGSSFRKAS